MLNVPCLEYELGTNPDHFGKKTPFWLSAHKVFYRWEIIDEKTQMVNQPFWDTRILSRGIQNIIKRINDGRGT